MNNRHPARHRGFTLIELLVVIAITAILGAILFPVLAQACEKARQIAGLSNCRHIGTPLTLYCTDWEETFPQEHPGTGNPAVDDNTGQLEQIDYGSPFDEILPYVGGKDARKQTLYTCPSDPDPAGTSIPNCVGSSPGPLVSYVINAYYLVGARLAQIQEPAESIYIAGRSKGFCDVHHHPWLGEVDQPLSRGAIFSLAAQRREGEGLCGRSRQMASLREHPAAVPARPSPLGRAPAVLKVGRNSVHPASDCSSGRACSGSSSVAPLGRHAAGDVRHAVG